MRKLLPLLLASASSLLAAPNYPTATRGAQVDDFFGTKVPDPYRWMEDIDSAETKAWVAAERALTGDALGQMPEREALRSRMLQLWNYPRCGLPFKRAGRVFFSKNDGLQNQSVFYVQDSATAAPRVLLDPNPLSKDGTVAITTPSPSPDGKWFGYAVASAGSDWRELKLRSLATGEDATDTIKWVKFSGLSWTKDAKGFFYGRYPTPKEGEVFSKLEHRQLYYHRVGTSQSEDRLVYEMPDHPDWSFGGEVSDDGRYLFIEVSQPKLTRNALYYLDLRDAKAPSLDGIVVKLCDAFDANYNVVGNHADTFYVYTNNGAPRGRIVGIDLKAPAQASWKTLVAETTDSIESVAFVGGRFVVTAMHDAANKLLVYDSAGKSLGEIALPGLGSIGGVSGRDDEPDLYYNYSSFLERPTVCHYNLDTKQGDEFGPAKIPAGATAAFDPSKYVTEEVFFPSKDGTKIPLFITHRRGVKLDGSSPTWLYGYGGFNIAHKPAYAVPTLVWLEMGGIYADVCLRGGSEYGDAWHLAGTKERKQNVFDDFIGAADWLVAQGYTKHDRLVIDGRSNGGLLVGAVLNQRPDLCGVALPAVGVMDMLRYHKFTIGAAWAGDYGTSDSAEGFKYLSAYSPVHTVKAGVKYPAVLIATGDHDDRVFPAHSYKYAAAMQAAAAQLPGSGPIYIRIDGNAGHGGSSGTAPVSKTVDEWADRMGFAAHVLGLKL